MHQLTGHWLWVAGASVVSQHERVEFRPVGDSHQSTEVLTHKGALKPVGVVRQLGTGHQLDRTYRGLLALESATAEAANGHPGTTVTLTDGRACRQYARSQITGIFVSKCNLKSQDKVYSAKPARAAEALSD